MCKLWFHPSDNRFYTEKGDVIHDMRPLFAIWELEQWKKKRTWAVINSRTGELYELFYCDQSIEDHMESHSFLFTMEDDVENYERYKHCLWKDDILDEVLASTRCTVGAYAKNTKYN